MKIFHGGCLGCTNQEIYSIDYCKECMYYNFDVFSDRPNLHNSEQRKEYDPVSDRYYVLKSDEKIVHVQTRYEVDEQGQPFQPIITRIVRKDNVNDVRWESPDGVKDKTIKMSEEVEHVDVTYMGRKIRIPSQKAYIVHDNSGSVRDDIPTDTPTVGYTKKFELIDELQKETDEWLNELNLEAV